MRRLLSSIALTATVIAFVLCEIPASAASSRVAASAAAPAGSTNDWPQLLFNARHTSFVGDPRLAASADSSMGLKWMSPLRSADLGSPVAAFNASLNKTLVYVGDERGDVTAYDESTGATVWSTSVGFGDSERATPMVAGDGSVWVATAYSSSLIKLNAANGSVLCSVQEAIHFNASPMLVTPPGGVPTVYIATNDIATMPGPEIAVRESDCKTLWTFDKYLQNAGAWATTAYGVDKNGRALVFVGTSDPDSTEYALDAKTGALVWHFSIYNPPSGIYDIGAAATVSLPGNNGFADGVVYVPTKYGIMYALDLTTGKVIWQYNFNKVAGTTEGGRSSAALDGTVMVFGMADGAFALDAVKGTLLWHYKDQSLSEVLSSPAIVGPPGDQAVTFGDVAGTFHVLRLADGKELYHYQTGGYITSSPAIIDGHILIDSSDGFLYDFMPGGGNAAPGTTHITFPAQGSANPNPNGNLVVQGTAADKAGLTGVSVSIQSGGQTGPWYNAKTGTWGPGVVDNVVAVAQPGGTSSAWSFPFPVPAAGTTYQVFANAVDKLGQLDRIGVQPTFTVMPSKSQPTLTLSALFVAPGESLTVSASAFKPSETVVYTLQGSTVGTATANSTGFVPPVSVTVPIADAFGLTAIVATGKTSGKTTTGPLDISNQWSQAGYGSKRTSYEPNDNVLAQTLQATKKGYVSRAWLFLTGAAVDASPAIAAGNAYVANDAGQVTAIDTISGAPLWTYTTPTGKPIHASPAVDMNAGLLFFGSDDGTLYTVALTTGALVGSSKLDGIPTAPALANGKIYVATDAGTLDAINETTGALVWSIKLGAAVHSAPSVDPVAAIVALGDDSGAVTALNAGSGATLWSVKTGNAVSASPAISGGIVYVGSNDGKLYARKETSGAAVFTFNAGASIRSGASVLPGGVFFGADNGILYDIGLTSGNLMLRNATLQGPIVGVGSVNQVPWAETSGGVIGAAKTDQELRMVYTYKTGAGLSTAPAIVDGAVYVGAEDGGLYAFTPYGFAPLITSDVQAQRNLLKAARPPAPWTQAFSQRGGAIATRSFEPFGPRQYALHLDRAAYPSGTRNIRSHGGAVQPAPRSYLISWTPNGIAPAAAATSLAAMLRTAAAYAGAAVDTTPYPARIDDAAVQHVVERQVAANHWKTDINAQVFVVTGSAITASREGYCAYHSAFNAGGIAGLPIPYAFVPFPDLASGCGALAPLLHREQIEMRSDPLLDAYHDELGNEPTR